MARRIGLAGIVTSTLVLIGASGLAGTAPAIGQELPGEKPAAEQSAGQLLFNVRHHIQMRSDTLALKYVEAVLGRQWEKGDLINAINNDPILARPAGGLADALDKVADWSPKTPEEQQLKQAAQRLRQAINDDAAGESNSPEVIRKEIERLSGNPRERARAMERLAKMGAQAVPLMLDVLRDQKKIALVSGVVWALPQMGREAVEPLCAFLDAEGEIPTKITVVNSLAEIGYPHALPSIQREAEQSQSEQLKSVCQAAVRRLGQSPRAALFSGSAARMFTHLGDSYYSDEPSLRPPRLSMVPVWYFDAAIGVRSIDVPRAIYNEIMAMRCFERALLLDPNLAEAHWLWIAANIRREAELPAGQADPTCPPDRPKARYYAVIHGPVYISRALMRTCQDRDTMVVRGLVDALADVSFGDAIGAEELTAFSTVLQYPDRQGRYLMAIGMVSAAARCKSILRDVQMAAPILADALGQTGEQFAVCLLPETQEGRDFAARVQEAGFQVNTAATWQAAMELARGGAVPHVDLLVIGYDFKEGGLGALAKLRQDYRFANAATLLIAIAPQKAKADIGDGLKSVAVLADTAMATEIAEKVKEVRADTGDSPLSEDEAKSYALRAAAALRDLASAKMDFSMAVPALLRALADKRLEVAVAAADALSYAASPDVQRSLARCALDAKGEPERRIAAFKAVAGAAKQFGSHLLADQVEGLVNAGLTEADLEVRNAAAVAVGSMNLASDKIAKLITAQSLIGKPMPAAAPVEAADTPAANPGAPEPAGATDMPAPPADDASLPPAAPDEDATP